MKRPILYALIPFCLGIALSGSLGISILCSIILSAIFVIVAAICSRHKTISHSALFLAILFAGISASLNSNILPQDHSSNFIPQDAQSVVCVKGIIVDDPIVTTTLYRTVRTSFTLRADSLKYGASWRKVSGLVKADLFSKRIQKLHFGSEVMLTGHMSKPHGLSNPGLFNYAEYLGLKDIYCAISVSDGNAIGIDTGSQSGSLRSVAYRIRHKMLTSIDEYMSMPYSGFLKAILAGDKTELKDSVQDNFIKTGTVHVIAVSGLQVALIASVFLLIFKVFGVPKKGSLAVTTILLIFYAFIGGANPPIIRSVIMFAVYSAGYIINREADALNSLSIAALAILIPSPKTLYDPSFQLSFVCIASTLVFTPKLNALFPVIVSKKGVWNGWAKAYSYVSTGVSVSVAAWLGSFPIVASYFNIFSPISIIANLIVIPILFLMVAASFLFFAFYFVSAFAAAAVANSLQMIEKALFTMNGYLAGMPFAFFRIAKPSIAFTVLYYMLATLLIMPSSFEFLRVRITRMRVAIFLLVLLNIVAWRTVIDTGPKGLKATFLDVGQGDSMFMQFPGGGTMLLDGGSGGDDDRSDMGRSVVAPYLWNRNVGTVDVVIVSHLHEDHMGGILYVLKKFKVGCVIDGGATGENGGKIYGEYLSIIKKKGIRHIRVGEGDIIKAFAGSEILVLNPGPARGLPDENNNSLVLKLIYKDRSFLLCGDIKDKAISRLVSYGDLLGSDVMKVPHHGGDLGNSKIVGDFFTFAAPDIAIISVGAANKYGMPSGETIGILTDLHSKRYATKDYGAIEILIDSNSGVLKTAFNNKN